MVGLSEAAAKTRFRRLSGGERQRLSLALALVGRPAVAILDEPTAGMDVEARAATRELLRGLRDEGTAVLLTSHDLADVERVADRIAIIDRGRLVAMGAPDELVGASVPVLRFRLATPLADADRSDLAARLAEGTGLRPAIEEDGGPGRYRVAGLTPSPATVAALAAWCEARGALVVELRTGGGSLEERYLELIGSTPTARRRATRTCRDRRRDLVTGAAAPAPRAVAAMTAMELRLALRRGENLFATIVIPTIVLVLFSSIAIFPTGTSRGVDFLLPGTIALAIVATSLVSLGITTAYDRSYGVLKRLGGSPLSRASWSRPGS